MARSVEDTALLLDAMTGEDPLDPVSLPRTESFLAAGALRLAAEACRLLGRSRHHRGRSRSGRDLPRRGSSICRGRRHRGGAHPDLSEAHDSFQVLRGLGFAAGYAGLLKDHRDKMRPEVIWNIEKGLGYSVPDIVRYAETNRAAMFRRMNAFFDN